MSDTVIEAIPTRCLAEARSQRVSKTKVECVSEQNQNGSNVEQYEVPVRRPALSKGRGRMILGPEISGA